MKELKIEFLKVFKSVVGMSQLVGQSHLEQSGRQRACGGKGHTGEKGD